MLCSSCHTDGEFDDPNKLQHYIWQTEDGHIIFICPHCMVKIIAEYMAKKDIIIATPAIPVIPAIRKLELD